MSSALRGLIVNGDDFGQSAGTNAGVAAAHEYGVLTSASLMVRWPAATAAAAYARTHRRLGVGLHVDFGEWTYRKGEWVPLYDVVPIDDADAVEREALRQLERFRDLVGMEPTHLDSHQHVHRHEPVKAILRAIAGDLDVPLRECAPGIHYVGDFYGQTLDGLSNLDAINADGLRRILSALGSGITELSCHPATQDDVESMYRRERQVELRTLCDPGIRLSLIAEGIVLQSFREVNRNCVSL